MKARKNFYHDVESIDWDRNLKGRPADYIGLIPKEQGDIDFESIGKLTKSSRIEEWVRPYN